MKKLIFLILCCLTLNTYAQDTVKKSNNIGNFTERFTVLKSDKKIRHGSYKLFDSNNKMLATGKYDQGKRTGLWDFYANNILVQQYDYTANQIISNFPDKSNISYEVPEVNPGDSVIARVKIGGYKAGFMMMEQYTDYLKSLMGFTGAISLDHLVSLDEKGKIISWIMRSKNSGAVKMKRVPFDKVPDDGALFMPATLNGKKVASTIVFHEELYTTAEIKSEVVGVKRTTNSSDINIPGVITSTVTSRP